MGVLSGIDSVTHAGEDAICKIMLKKAYWDNKIFSRSVKCVVTSEKESFIRELTELTKRNKENEDRIIIGPIDCSKLRKNDFIGLFCRLSASPESIIIFENINRIPDGNRDIYDDPAYVKRLINDVLINEESQYSHEKFGTFSITRSNYTFIILYERPETKSDYIQEDFEQINFDEDQQKLERHPKMLCEDLINAGVRDLTEVYEYFSEF